MKSNVEIERSIGEIRNRVKRYGQQYAKSKIGTAESNLILSAVETNYNAIVKPVIMRAANLKGVATFAKTGNYNDLTPHDRVYHDLEEDYLYFVGKKCSVAFDSTRYNNMAIIKLRRERGPKDLERRLKSFLKRKIDEMVK